MKRIFDLILSALGLIILFIPMLIIAILVTMTSPGSAIYWSDRVGKDGEIFKMAKFRSMRLNTPAIATDLMRNPDFFITPIGKFLRKSSLDELPQLWNILLGDMSFVGPRPALYNQYELIQKRYEVGIDSLRPGLTGWAQVNGRDEIPVEDKVHYDCQYLQQQSLLLDLKILLLTVGKVFRSDGVAH
nr:sugar transferase [Polynucleobacter sp. AP-Capit-er-40B-B4]